MTGGPPQSGTTASPIAARPYTAPPAPQPAATSRPPAWWEQKQAANRP